MLKCNYRGSISRNCAPNLIQNSDILNTLGNTSAENKEIECTIAYNSIKVGFHLFTVKMLPSRERPSKF